MEETTFLADGRVTITNEKFLVEARTFAMNSVTSVKEVRESPSRLGPAILMLIGLATGFLAQRFYLLAALLFLGGVAWWVLQKPVFHVVLTTSSGEEDALASVDKEWVGKVVAALNESIKKDKA